MPNRTFPDKQYQIYSLREIDQALRDSSIKVGKLAQIALFSILQHRDFPESAIRKLCNKSISTTHLNLSLPLLVRIAKGEKRPYYYVGYLKCHGKYYAMCNCWSERQRNTLVRWIYHNKIDPDETRQNWQPFNVKTGLVLNLQARRANKAPATANIKNQPTSRVHPPTGSLSWNIEAQATHSSTNIATLIIQKLAVSITAKLKSNIFIQVRTAEKLRYYKIKATIIDNVVKNNPIRYESKNKAFWKLKLDTTNGRLYQSRKDTIFTIGYCKSYDIVQDFQLSHFPQSLRLDLASETNVSEASDSPICKKTEEKAHPSSIDNTIKAKALDLNINDWIINAEMPKSMDDITDIRIHKEALRTTAQDNRNCNIRLAYNRAGKTNKWFQISARILLSATSKSPNDFIVPRDKNFWHFRFNIRNGKLYNYNESSIICIGQALTT